MAAIDKFTFSVSGESPGLDIFAITPSDAAELEFVTRGIYIVEEGALRVVTYEDRDIVLPSGLLASGICHPLRVKKVFATDTTATGVHGVT